MNRRDPIIQPLFLAAVLAVGFGLVWGALAAFGVMLVEQATLPNRVYRHVEVTGDGTPVIRSHSFRDFPRVTFETIDGRPLPMSRQEVLISGTSLPVRSGNVRQWGNPSVRQRVQPLINYRIEPGDVCASRGRRGRQR